MCAARSLADGGALASLVALTGRHQMVEKE